ncbi:MAG TPA: alpha-2-macroglobulin family protein [Kofleriaceae bacterium]|jgi:hypothetical protein
MRRAAFVALLAACGSSSSSSPPPREKASAKVATPALPLIELTVSEGAKAAPPPTVAPPIAKLSPAETAALLARVPALPALPGDVHAVALRPASKAPPKPGAIVPMDTGSAAAPASAPTGAAKVVRYAPSGPIRDAQALSITFDQPMVALGGPVETPVTLSPQPKGQWRWLGTKTLVFEPDGHAFPRATKYSVLIPGGWKGSGGVATASTTAFAFETPAPTLASTWPAGNSARTDTPIYIELDQPIDPTAVAAKIRVTAGGHAVAIRALTAAEIAASPEILEHTRAAAAQEHGHNWLAIRPTEPLPTDADISVQLPAGTAGTEGPVGTPLAQSFAFHTYPPLTALWAHCHDDSEPCRPGEALSIGFSTPLDFKAFDPSTLSIEPALAHVHATVSGDRLVVYGETEPRTTYRVHVPAALVDAFGQTLGTDRTFAFAVGDRNESIDGPQGLVVLDPTAPHPALRFTTANHAQLAVALYQVTPADYDAFRRYAAVARDNRAMTPPGTKVFDGLVATNLAPNEQGDTLVDLSPALPSGHGSVVAVVEPTDARADDRAQLFVVWAQATRLGVDLVADNDQIVGFATDLATGKPLAGVTLDAQPWERSATTDAQGLATLPIDRPRSRLTDYVIATLGDDRAIVRVNDRTPEMPYAALATHELLGYVFDDRMLYRPGETVSLKGWARLRKYGPTGDLEPTGLAQLHYLAYDGSHNTIGEGNVPVDALGGFSLQLALPPTPALGEGYVELSAPGDARTLTTMSLHDSFRIEEFRRPEFEVTAAPPTARLVAGEAGDVSVHAAYFSGGGLPNAQVHWRVSAGVAPFTPPNRDAYAFGQPLWGGRGGEYDARLDDFAANTWQLDGRTDPTGTHLLHLAPRAVHPEVPVSLTATADVQDVNRQTWSASTSVLVHPAALTVGLKLPRAFVEQGDAFVVEAIGVDLEGVAAPGAPISITTSRIESVETAAGWETRDVDPQTCNVTAAADSVRCTFQSPKGGAYHAVATIRDAKGRTSRSAIDYWVAGGPPERTTSVGQESVQLVPDKATYAPGDTADVLVRAPFAPSEGLVTWRRGGIAHVERISLTGGTAALHVPLPDALVPGIDVCVELVGIHDKRPAYAQSCHALAVPPTERTLAVAVKPSTAELAPGGALSVGVTITDAHGAPVTNAQAAIVVVDESVLALAGGTYADPIAAFYSYMPDLTGDYHTRESIVLAEPRTIDTSANQELGYRSYDRAEAADGEIAFGASGGERKPMAEEQDQRAQLEMGKDLPVDAFKGTPGRSRSPSIAVRSKFGALAAFSPAVKTDAHGHATLAVTLPDSLTRYRIVAIAAAGDRQFGKGEGTVTAKLPLMVRPSAPRFLHFGDAFELPVVVQNQTDAPLPVSIAVRTANATLTDGAGRSVTIPAHDRVEIRFPAAAALAGTARFQVVGVGGGASDAADVQLPVWTPATTEAFATYGTIDAPLDSIAQPIAAPADAIPGVGGIEVSVASTNLQSLTDALLYLARYPYECAEQRSSRILAIASLKDVLAAFGAKDLPAPDALAASVAADVDALVKQQNSDGGFAYWDTSHPSDPYLSVYVASALAQADRHGFPVPPTVLVAAQEYVRTVDMHIPVTYPPEARASIRAFALAERRAAGKLEPTDIAEARALLATLGGAPAVNTEVAGWLLAAMAQDPASAAERAALVRELGNRVTETAGAAHFATAYAHGSNLVLASDRRSDAIVLDALIAEQPASDLIPKLVAGLLGHRTAGRWESTQESAFALLALEHYFRAYEKVTPDFVARVWLGNDAAGEHAFRGHTTETAQLDLPLASGNVTIAREGAGRLYYRIGMTYAPPARAMGPLDAGFTVERRYEALDDQRDVQRQPDGSWAIRAGARVRVRVSVVAPAVRYHVAVVDPMPAGLEAQMGSTQADWSEHSDLRDERAEAFAGELPGGLYDFAYDTRATTPGTFVVPPPKAEEMYAPETFGRGASDLVIVR